MRLTNSFSFPSIAAPIFPEVRSYQLPPAPPLEPPQPPPRRPPSIVPITGPIHHPLPMPPPRDDPPRPENTTNKIIPRTIHTQVLPDPLSFDAGACRTCGKPVSVTPLSSAMYLASRAAAATMPPL